MARDVHRPLLRRNLRDALVIAALVASHWLLDAIVHRPDPPPYPGSSTRVGQAQWLLVLWAFWVDNHRRLQVPR